jgi:enterochelin esterase-like enzyme
MRRALLAGSLAMLVLVSLAPARAQVAPCAKAVPLVVAGVVATAKCRSNDLGGITDFSYYVPRACSKNHRCPVLYLLHGFGGDPTDVMGTAGKPSMYVRALSSDPVTGRKKSPIDFILIAPDGRTVHAGADTPKPGQDSYWVDWNPRYWKRPPRFEHFVTSELRSLVERSFPTVAAREWRAILGVSLGGFGSFKLAFQHPDLYASAGSISGALNFLVAPDVQPIGPGTPGLGGAPAPLPHAHAPRLVTTPPGFPYGDPFGAFGDLTADEAYFRGNNALDLAINARGLGLRFFHNDLLPQDPSDLSDPGSYAGGEIFESLVFPMNLEMRAALTQDGIPFDYELHHGNHSDPFRIAYIRKQLEWQYARASHAGHLLRSYVPASFDYRSIRSDFSVWGWTALIAQRPQEEFLTLWDVSKRGLSVTGSGAVTITTPPLRSLTGFTLTGSKGAPSMVHLSDGRFRISFNMGSSENVADERGGSTGIPNTSNTVKICFGYRGARPAC